MACEIGCATCTPEIRAREFISMRDKLKMYPDDTFVYNFNEHSKPTHMVLSVTNACNLSCPYCFVEQNPTHMELETAIQAVEWLKTNHIEKQEKNRPTLSFFGGEPLIRFDEIIKPIVEKYCNEVDFSVTTNGVLLDEDKVDFFYKYNVNVLLSFDGIQEVQNSQRPAKEGNSFIAVTRNIPYLLMRFPNTVMRATVTKASIPHMLDTVLMAEKIGFKHITFCENGYEEWDKETEKAFEQQLLLIGERTFKGFFSNEIGYLPIKADPLTKYYHYIMNSSQGSTKFYNGVMRCGLGTVTCGVAPNGDIIPCQEKNSKNNFAIGNVFTGIDPIKHEVFLMNYLDKLNNFVCDRGCNTKDKLYCLSNFCPSRFEDMNYSKSTASCAFSRMSTKVAARLYFLCADSCHENIKYYFQDKGGEPTPC